jgi:hypothetical protein
MVAVAISFAGQYPEQEEQDRCATLAGVVRA